MPQVDQEYDKILALRLEGTCKWIFNHPAYLSWQTAKSSDNPTGKVLWIHGPPGFGKTVLAASVVEALKGASLVAYAFSSAYVQAGAKPHVIVRTWIHQLIRKNAAAHDLAWRRLTEPNNVAVASQSDAWALLSAILAEIPGCILTLDGLDEFDRSDNLRSELLQALMSAVSHTDTRVLLISRDDISAEIFLAMTESTTPIWHECAICEKDVELDIGAFCKHIMGRKLPHHPEQFRNDIADKMIEKAGGMFLWIKMQESQLEDYKSKASIEKIINRMPKGLQRVYQRDWKDIWTFGEDDQERAVTILRWAAFSLEPLTVYELAEALLLDSEANLEDIDFDDLPPITETYINYGIRRLCGSFVNIRSSDTETSPGARTVHIVHSTAKDFILLTEPPGAPSEGLTFSLCGVASQHTILAKTCIQFISIEEAWDHTPSAFLRYSSRKSLSHIRAAGKEDPEVVDYLTRFFMQHQYCFFSWRSSTSFAKEENGSNPGGPLYYASLFNLPETMKALRYRYNLDINRIGGAFGTALQAACAKGNREAFDLLIQWGADVNIKAGRWGSALIAAVESHQESMIACLLEHGASSTLLSGNVFVPTAMYVAVSHRLPDITKLLLEHGAKSTIDTPNIYDWTPISYSVFDGNLESVQTLLEYSADSDAGEGNEWKALTARSDESPLHLPKEQDSRLAIEYNDGWTALHTAMWKGDSEIVKLLLGFGADPNHRNIHGDAPLHIAALEGHTEAIEVLLDRGAHIDPKNAASLTPLHVAARSGMHNTVAFLLRRGANISNTSLGGWTPLHSAAAEGSLEKVKLLMQYGADPKRTQTCGGTGPGDTALSTAASYGRDQVVEFLMDINLDLKHLIKKGSSETLINKAVVSRNMRLIKQILSNHSKDNLLPDAHGMTPLHFAALMGNIQAFDYLCDYGFSPRATDVRGKNVLHFAAASSSVEMVKRILRLPNVSSLVSDHAGWTPLHWACRTAGSKMARLLMAAGVEETAVDVSNPSGSFSPWEIALFHNNWEVMDAWEGSANDEMPPASPNNVKHSVVCDACTLVCPS